MARSRSGCGRPGLDFREGQQERGRGRKRRERGRRERAVALDQRERQDERGEAGGGQQRAGDVERRRVRVAPLLQDARCQQRRGGADRHVDQEHPAPVEQAAEDAAQHPAAGAAARRRGGPPAERLRRRGSAAVTSASAAGETSAAPMPWTARAASSAVGGRREPAGERGRGEHAQPERERAPPADPVRQSSRGQQAAAEDERVDRDHPPERRRREAQVGLHGGQRDGDDRDVEDDHELRDAGSATTIPWGLPARVTLKHAYGGNTDGGHDAPRRRPPRARARQHGLRRGRRTGRPRRPATPDDLVTFAGGLGVAAVPDASALAARERCARRSTRSCARTSHPRRGGAAPRGAAPRGGAARGARWRRGGAARRARGAGRAALLGAPPRVRTSWGEADVAPALAAFEVAVRAAQARRASPPATPGRGTTPTRSPPSTGWHTLQRSSSPAPTSRCCTAATRAAGST